MRAFSTDGPVTDGPKGVRANETIIVGDLRMVALRKDTPAEHVHLGNSGEPIALEEADSVRPEAYMASWRKEHGSDGPALGKQTEPALTRRVAKGLEVLYDAFHERAEWFLIVDDDTFVRWGPLRAYLATLDPDKPQILGSPMDSSKMLSPEGRARGASVHCGGGAGWILSRAALAVLRPRLSECLSQREVVKTWYYDEVVLGRCLHHFSGLACQRVPGMGWTTADALRPDLEERTGYPVLSVHPALPSDMARLRAAFSEAIDKKWVRRFHRDGLPEPVPFATTV